MHKLYFSLNIPAQEYLQYYQGNVTEVQVRCDDGRLLNFPAAELRRYVERSGIAGRFEIEFDDNNKLVELRRIE